MYIKSNALRKRLCFARFIVHRKIHVQSLSHHHDHHTNITKRATAYFIESAVVSSTFTSVLLLPLECTCQPYEETEVSVEYFCTP
jgi:hypothetical protein